jgi:hypothetical protein
MVIGLYSGIFNDEIAKTFDFQQTDKQFSMIFFRDEISGGIFAQMNP